MAKDISSAFKNIKCFLNLTFFKLLVDDDVFIFYWNLKIYSLGQITYLCLENFFLKFLSHSGTYMVYLHTLDFCQNYQKLNLKMIIISILQVTLRLTSILLDIINNKKKLHSTLFGDIIQIKR